MKGQDEYKEIRTMHFPGMVARIYIPDLTEEERTRRMRVIHKQAANLLMPNITKSIHKER